MTNEELDKARADEAYNRWYRLNAVGETGRQVTSALIAARLAREGWTPEDPLLQEARELCAQWYDKRPGPYTAAGYRKGDNDHRDLMVIALSALRRGMELEWGKAR